MPSKFDWSTKRSEPSAQNTEQSTTQAKLKHSLTVQDAGISALEHLAGATSLSKQKVKEVMSKGGVWLKQGTKPQKRLRRVKSLLKPGDRIKLFFDPAVLRLEPRQPSLIHEEKTFSVWYKPAGLLSQGTEWGDHCSLLRCVEVKGIKETAFYQNPFLLHRLDRDASGIVVIAHNKLAAAKFSELLQQRKLQKHYLALVSGELPEAGEINASLDGKEAQTEYRRLAWNSIDKVSLVEIDLITGRQHQIRRHFAAIDHPLVGDRLYGVKEAKQLCLIAHRLAFQCPISHSAREFSLPASYMPGWSAM